MISDSLNVSHQQPPVRHSLLPQKLFAGSFSYSLACPKGKELFKNQRGQWGLQRLPLISVVLGSPAFPACEKEDVLTWWMWEVF